jgi:hypothetical protein
MSDEKGSTPDQETRFELDEVELIDLFLGS